MRRSMRPLLRHGVQTCALVGALALVLAACGGDDDDDDASSSGATTTVAESSDATTTPTTSASDGGAAVDQAATVAIAQTPFGDALVDESGLTLYVFENDSPLVSMCTEGCADAWPPVVVTGDIVVGDGLNAADFTTFDRGGGEMQLAVRGRPLYRFAQDTSPGETNGQGVGSVWYIAAPDGSSIMEAASSGNDSQSNGPDNY